MLVTAAPDALLRLLRYPSVPEHMPGTAPFNCIKRAELS
jgi:hypothetical protein